jgi:hypothetical protein
MKNIFVALVLSALAVFSVSAQGLVNFANANNTKISTNSLYGGAATGLTGTGSGQYCYALFYSTTATSVGGQTNAISGGSSIYYAVNDSAWTMVGYGTNTALAGRLISASTNPIAIPGLAGGLTAQFVVIGWSANIGTDIAVVQRWLDIDPIVMCWIGQSAVSGPITVGDGGVIATPSLFGSSAPAIQGFTLGLAGYEIIYAPPYIASQPADVTVSVDDNAYFSVQASGYPTPSCQWQFNRTNISGATGFSLTITNVQMTNAGNYSVFISNVAGSTNSAAAVLTVQPGTPPIITAQPFGTSVPVGGTAFFTVTAGGSSPLNYQWSFNNTNLPNATNATLTLTGVQTTNAGNYSVAITNLYGATNSFPATLSVITSPQNCGYVIFGNNNNSATKIFTNSAVGGAATGLTAGSGGLYRYALFASATATSVNGQTSAITGRASGNYAFNDGNWTLVAYATNTLIRGRLLSASNDGFGQTPLLNFAGGASGQLVVVGWSANIGPDISSVQAWYAGGNPAFDGWIGQSAVSGTIQLGDGAIIPSPVVFGSVAPSVQGFTLGLVSPNMAAAYAVPYAPPAILQTKLLGNSVQLSWPTAAGSFGVQSASHPAGPWSDTGWSITTNGVNSTVTAPATNQQQFFRLMAQ